MIDNSLTVSTAQVAVGTVAFTASLLDSPTVSAFRSLFPLELQMSDLNSNEKYADLPTTLPNAAEQIGSIRAGDLMLFGSRTLVLWYEDYSTSYTYTRIGSLDNPEGLAGLVESGTVQVRFGAHAENATNTVSGELPEAGSGTPSSASRVRLNSSKRRMWLLTSLIGLACALAP